MKKGRAYSDYDPIKVIWPIKGDVVTDDMAAKAGLSGAFIEVEPGDLPADRTNRGQWKVVGNKVKEDAKKVAEKNQERAVKEEKKNSMRNKLKALGLTNDEVDLLKGGD